VPETATEQIFAKPRSFLATQHQASEIKLGSDFGSGSSDDAGVTRPRRQRRTAARIHIVFSWTNAVHSIPKQP
jgi:hypothetical protein